MNIKNYDDLFSSLELGSDLIKLRRIGLAALNLAVESVRPQKLIQKSVRIEKGRLIVQNDVYNLRHYKNIYIIGGGKAVAEMANSIARMLDQVPDINYKGVINIQEGLNIDDIGCKHDFQINIASHPLPNRNGLKGTRAMINLIKFATDSDLILCLISGGGSALLPLPRNDITLAELTELNFLLLESGASIHEINTIRKHISDFKGGNLAKTVFKTSNATLVCLIISDVIGNNLDSIASGPTVPDPTTFKDALLILKKYDLLERIPPQIRKVLEEGLKHPELENPKEEDLCFNRVHNYLIGSVEDGINEVAHFLQKNAYSTEIISTTISGEAKDFSKLLYQIIKKYTKRDGNLISKKQIALIGSGELTVTIKGNGIGGRNQEMLLAYLDLLKNKIIDYSFLILAANLDGIEGNSLAMGALIDNQILNEIISHHIEPFPYLQNNNSNGFFKMLKTEIITGPTGCNVNDIIIILLQI